MKKLKPYGISGLVFAPISFSLSNRWFCLVLDGKSSQKYPVNARVPQGSFFHPTLFHYTLMTLLMKLSVRLLPIMIILLSKYN